MLDRNFDFTLIFPLVNIAIKGILNQSAEELIWQDGLSERELIQLIDLLENNEYDLVHLSNTFKGELLFSSISISSNSVPDILGDLELIDGEIEHERLVIEFIKLYKNIIENLKHEAFVKMSFKEAKEFKEYEDAEIIPAEVLYEILPYMIQPAMIAAIQKVFQGKAKSRLTRISGALRLFHLRNNRLPNKLSELSKVGIMENIPVNPLTGKEFDYSPAKRTISFKNTFGKRKYEKVISLSVKKLSFKNK
ncbi:MAG: hypothetical protein NE334_09635 [Lentisphaeraceae bacterium]|nr:hypothetical protein [Lentisphaeraceae bacterium]